MKRNSLIRQTLFLSGSHFAVRAVGFVMRIWLSRELGAAAMGLVELAHSAQMLLITPVVSGLPAAVSRLSAQASGQSGRQSRVLRCGVLLALMASMPLCIAAFLLREPLAVWLGDIRTLPALLIYLPCIPILGVSCALNGHYYGTGHPVPPAVSEMLEQAIRFILSIRLVALLRDWPMTLRAAVPAAAALAGETIGLFFMLILCAPALFIIKGDGSYRAILREMLRLALPLTGMRIVSSLMRTANATLIPARLQTAGLPKAEALSQLGMLNGMLMPMLLLPSFITCSLCMVASPELTRRQSQCKPIAALCRKMLLAALGIGLAAMVCVMALAPFIAGSLYRQTDLLPLLRICSPLIPFFSLSQVTGGIMNGLGLQGASLRISLFSSLTNVLLTYVLAAQPALRLYGALAALAASLLVTLILSLKALKQTISLHEGYTAR